MKVVTVFVLALAVGSISADPLDIGALLSTAVGNDIVPDLVTSIIEAIGDEDLSNFILGKLNPIILELKIFLATYIGEGVVTILNRINKLFCTLMDVLSDIINSIIETISTILGQNNLVGFTLRLLLRAVKSALTFLSECIKEVLELVFEDFGQFFQQSFIKAVLLLVNPVISAIESLISELDDENVEGSETSVIVERLESIFGDITSAFGGLFKC